MDSKNFAIVFCIGLLSSFLKPFINATMLICYFPVSWRMDNICLLRCHMGGECRRQGPSVQVVEILTDKLLGTCERNRMWLRSLNQDSEGIQRLYQLLRYNHPEYGEERGKKAVFVVKDTCKAKKLVHHKHLCTLRGGVGLRMTSV